MKNHAVENINNTDSIDKFGSTEQARKFEFLLAKYVLLQLTAMKLFLDSGKGIVELKHALLPMYGRWLDETIRVLEKHELLLKRNDQYYINNSIADACIDFDNKFSVADWEIQSAPFRLIDGLRAQVNIVEKILITLPEILKGERPATDILFPKSSINVVENTYKDNPVADLFNTTLADIALAYVEEKLQKEPTDKIKIIEIGAGTGGTSRLVLEKLKPYAKNIIEYCYTDISKAFLFYAEDEFGSHYNNMNFQLFNVERSPESQDIQSGSYDLVIATNVLHATKDIKKTLANTKSLLQKNGLILLNEMIGSDFATHLTFGLLEGWWLYEDEHLRIPGCPGIAPETWKTLLEDKGFNHVVFPLKRAHGLGSQLVVAESDGIIYENINQESLSGIKNSAKPLSALVAQVQQHASETSLQSVQKRTTVNSSTLDGYVCSTIKEVISKALRINLDSMQDDRNFSDYGVDSIVAVNLVNLLSEVFSIRLQTTILFDYSNVKQLTVYLCSEYGDALCSEPNSERLGEVIAEDFFDDVESDTQDAFGSAQFSSTIATAYKSQDMTEYLRSSVKEIISQSLRVDFSKIKNETNFSDYGVDSIIAVNLVNEMSEHFGIRLQTTILFDYSNVSQLIAYLEEEYGGDIVVPQLIDNVVETSVSPLENFSNFFSAHDDIEESSPVVEMLSVVEMFSEGELDNYIRESVKTVLSSALRLDYKIIKDDKSFSDYGVDSIVAVNLVNIMSETFGISLQTTILFDYSNISQLVEYLKEDHGDVIKSSHSLLQPSGIHDIASLGVAQKNNPSYRDEQGGGESSQYKSNDIFTAINKTPTTSRLSALIADINQQAVDHEIVSAPVSKTEIIQHKQSIPEKLKNSDVPSKKSGSSSLAMLIQQTQELAQGADVYEPVVTRFQEKNNSQQPAHIRPSEDASKIKTGQTLHKNTIPGEPRNQQIHESAEKNAHVVVDASIDSLTANKQDNTYYRVFLDRPATVDAIKLAKSNVPHLDANSVRISIRACSLNFSDYLCVLGMYPSMPAYPFTPGNEVSGVVVSKGSAVTTINIGDEVISTASADMGGHATMIDCHETHVFPKPKNLSFEQACSLPAVITTMLYAFRKANIRPGEKILIQTAAGGTGLIAIQLAKYYQAEIYATAGSARKLQYLESLGVKNLINYQESDFAEEISRLTNGKGVDVIINTLPGNALQKGLNSLAPGGRYIEIAIAALKSAKAIDISSLRQNKSFFSIDIGHLHESESALMAEYRGEMLQFVEDGIITPTLSSIYSFENFKHAYTELHERKNIGKIVLAIPESLQYTEKNTNQNTAQSSSGSAFDPIAVIGMSGRFGRANSVAELWQSLASGEELVEGINRWDMHKFYPSGEGVNTNAHCFRGSFVECIDLFDPVFFNISGIEATYTDPQQRLFLEECWNALEDAGYAGEDIAEKRCGVYVGNGGSDYSDLFSDEIPAQAFWGNTGSIIPARIAYLLDLKGPTITVDTACSSSMTAIYLACQGLWLNDTDMALAGGVHIQSTPRFYLATANGSMLSPTGRCYTFDSRADGFVPGEGVAVLTLKRLSDAIQDGDHIYGSIRAAGMNQDGTTNGITAPSGKSQQKLIRETYKKFNVKPSEIQMMEAHGTGTKLGDPIEFNALRSVFKDTVNLQSCALGSIKTNLGHAASAAGVMGVIKVLLALKHKQIPASLNYEHCNPHIEMEKSPFFVNSTLIDWPEVNAKDLANYPRRCGAVSSFGLSGANVHIVLEEAPESVIQKSVKPYHLMFFSARTHEQLRNLIEKYLTFFRNNSDVDFANLAYTLCIGRRHFKHRIACVANDLNDLIGRLEYWAKEDKQSLRLYYGEKKQSHEMDSVLKRDGNLCIAKIGSTFERLSYEKQLTQIANLYILGYSLNYHELFQRGYYQRISLPTYPFAKTRFWVQEKQYLLPENNTNIKSSAPGLLNTSTFSEARFSYLLTGSELFLQDHKVNNQKILPGVFYLELARSATLNALGNDIFTNKTVVIRNIAWHRPVVVAEQKVQLNIGLNKIDNHMVDFEFYTDNCENENISVSNRTKNSIVHSKGRAEILPDNVPVTIDVNEIKKQCNEALIEGDDCYRYYSELGVSYGPSHLGVKNISVGKRQALAHLELDQPINHGEFFLSPGMLDCALQAIYVLLKRKDDTYVKAMLPIAIQSVEIMARCENAMWAHVRLSNGCTLDDNILRFDIDLCTKEHSLCVRFISLSIAKARDFLPHEHNTSIELQSQKSHVAQSKDKSFIPPVTLVQEAKCLIPIWKQVDFELGVGSSQHQQLSNHNRPFGVNPLTIFCPDSQLDSNILGGIVKKAASVKVIPTTVNDTIESIAFALEDLSAIENVIWIAPININTGDNPQQIIADQEHGVYHLFNLIKVLLSKGLGARQLQLTIVTQNTFSLNANDGSNVANTSIVGLIGSLAKEYSKWSVNLFDLESDNAAPLQNIFSAKLNYPTNSFSCRNGIWFYQTLAESELSGELISKYRQGGVYIIVGGAGGIGQALTQYLIKHYDAKIIWLGRSDKDKNISQKIAQSSTEDKVEYIQTDVTNRESIKEAYNQIKRRYKQINGLVHSAIVLHDSTIANMSKESFQASFKVKVDASVYLAEIFGVEPLDFMLYFSSMQSFVNAPGQSNYSAGCTFLDSFARYTSSNFSIPAKVINWGYWGDVGIVSSQHFRTMMANTGLISIESNEGMYAVENLLAGEVNQMAFVKLAQHNALSNLISTEKVIQLPADTPSLIHEFERNDYLLKQDLVPMLMAFDDDANADFPDVEQITVNVLLAQLINEGLIPERKWNFNSLYKDMAPLYQRWLRESLRIFVEKKYLLQSDDNYFLLDHAKKIAENAWSEWEKSCKIMSAFEAQSIQLKILETTIRSLPDVLRGRHTAVEVLFPKSSTDTVESLSKNNIVTDFYSDVVGDIVLDFVNHRLKENPSTIIRILEIGAGTGSTTSAIHLGLQSVTDSVEFCITDISKSFIFHAEENYGLASYLSYELLNIEKAIEPQGFVLGSFDIVVASNALHATSNIRNTLKNTKALLKKNGLLILNEISKNSVANHLTYGLLEGWWKYDDESVRIEGCPGLYPQQWITQLKAEGFNKVVFPFEESNAFGQQIILAESNGVVCQGHSTVSPLTKIRALKKPQSVVEKIIVNIDAINSKTTEKINDVSGKNFMQKNMRKEITEYLVGLVASVLRIPAEQIDIFESIDHYGMDSILALKLAELVTENFYDTNGTLFLEHKTIDEIIDQLIAMQPDACKKFVESKNFSAPYLDEMLNEENKHLIESNEEILVSKSPVVVIDTEQLHKNFINYLTSDIAEVLRIPKEHIDAGESLRDYGMDSILALRLADKLNEKLEDVSSIIFLEFHSINDIASYLITTQRGAIETLFKMGSESKSDEGFEKINEVTNEATSLFSDNNTASKESNLLTQRSVVKSTDVAIIGLAGRYPAANSISEFWQNLLEGKDCITEAPDVRWSHNIYVKNEAGQEEKKLSQWGGFIDNVDKFDPVFFNISPSEARIIDPQARLFLQVSWELFENAGYTRKALEEKCNGKIGVYVGAMYLQYQALRSDYESESIASISSYSSIANRVSNFFNLSGPSLAIDTMCSSSLIAIHLACEHLHNGQCKMALAGGVNLTLGAKKYLGLNIAGLLGSNSACRSFSQGDGFLPAEGVGAVLLKPLAQAIEDDDEIFAIIKSSTINHNGKGGGYGMPNVSSQVHLIEENLLKAGISPKTIGYIESSANGSPVADTVEIEALSRVFKSYLSDGQSCAIGSVKSIIGHAEASSGISQLSKVAMQIKNGVITPNIIPLHINPNIKFEKTPFTIQKELCKWPRPEADEQVIIPRRAMICSYGAGGSNANFILEEYINLNIDLHGKELNSNELAVGKKIIVLSARLKRQLAESAKNLLQFCKKQKSLSLADLAFTLQVAREEMLHRVAFIVEDLNQLQQGLDDFIHSDELNLEIGIHIPTYYGVVEKKKSGLKQLLEGDVGENIVDAFVRDKNLDKIALYWVNGGEVNWQLLAGHNARRIGHILPNYPFDLSTCWLPVSENVDEAALYEVNNKINSSIYNDSTVAAAIVAISANVLGLPLADLELDISLKDYGVNSVMQMRMYHRLKNEIKIHISIEEFANCETVQDILHLATNKVELTKSQDAYKSPLHFPELVLFNNKPGRPIFWIHAATGGVEHYRELALQIDRPFYGIQSRSYESEAKPIYGLRSLASYYLHIIRSVQPQGPYDIGGHSLGGYLAYELACQLQRQGEVVNSIVMVDTFCGENSRPVSKKSIYLQETNLELLSNPSVNKAKEIHSRLIHRDELNEALQDEEFVEGLAKLAYEKGWDSVTLQEITHIIYQKAEKFNSYGFDDPDLPPSKLHNSEKTICLYFRNKNGDVFGDLEPYHLLASDIDCYGDSNHSEQWNTKFKHFHDIEVDASSHMTMLSENEALKIIASNCNNLYQCNDAIEFECESNHANHSMSL